MTSEQIGGLEGFEALCEGEARPVGSIYCADLLSWAMSRAPEGCAWCTIMGNVNAVAVAALADVAAIVLCEGAVLDEDARQKAQQQRVSIYRTALPAFQAGLAVGRAFGLV